MTTGSRYPARFLLLAGAAGAMAWGLPWLLAPFTRIITYWLKIPEYLSPPYRILLGDHVIGYFLAGILAGGVILLGLRFLSSGKFTRPRLSWALALAVLAGMGISGALAILFALGYGYSQPGYSLFFAMYRVKFFFGIYAELPEPFLSIGLIFGAVLAVIPASLVEKNGVRRTLTIALGVFWRVLVVRLILFLVEGSSIMKFAVGKSISSFMIFELVAGLLAGMWVWAWCYAAIPHQPGEEKPLTGG